MLAACRNPEVSYNDQVHNVVPEIAEELAAMRRENHSDFEIMRRDLQLGQQHTLRLISNMLEILRGATITLPSITTSLNFSPLSQPPPQPKKGLLVRPALPPAETGLMTPAETVPAAATSFILPFHSALAPAPESLPPLRNQAAAGLAVQAKISLLKTYNGAPQLQIDRTVSTILNI